jgi:Flp pilus assembly protein TadG
MNRFKTFLRCNAGNTAMMFSLALVPLLLAVGSAVDMVRVNRTQAVLQGAADAAALAAGTSNLSNSDLNDLVTTYMESNGAVAALDLVESIEAKQDKQSGTYSVAIKGKMNTSFMHLVGVNTMDLGATAEVTSGSQALELVLVLDNTDSMNAEGRLTALKASAKALVEEIYENQEPGVYIKIGIVPFANYVNVGLPSRNEPWMSVPANSSVTSATPQCSMTYPDQKWINCVPDTRVENRDGVLTTVPYDKCDYVPGPEVQVCGPVTTVTQWNGCVGSRNNPLDTEIGSSNVRYPGVMNEWCPNPITDLTDDKDEIDGKIDAMVATGNTYIPAGLLWGWNVLNDAEPFTQAKSTSEMASLKGTKAIILMTDGKNTMVPTYPAHANADPAPQADALLNDICDNVKNDGIQIYTVAFKVDSSDAKHMLRDCATDRSKAFDADDSGELLSSFREIAQKLAAIRLTK